MKRSITVGMMMLVLILAFAGFSSAASEGKLDLKPGDSVYACNCGEACPCNGMGYHAGKCPCGHDEMVKANVTRIEGDNAYLKAEGWDKDRPFKMIGKYICACKPECTCNAISQTPGKCPCGSKMMKVK